MDCLMKYENGVSSENICLVIPLHSTTKIMIATKDYHMVDHQINQTRGFYQTYLQKEPFQISLENAQSRHFLKNDKFGQKSRKS